METMRIAEKNVIIDGQMIDSILSYFTAGGQLYGLFHQAVPGKNEECLQKLCHGRGTKKAIALHGCRVYH